MSDKPYSVKTLAERWDCSKQKIHNMIKAKEIKNPFPVGNMLRIPVWEIERIESCGIEHQNSTEENTTPEAARGRKLGENHLERQPWSWHGSA